LSQQDPNAGFRQEQDMNAVLFEPFRLHDMNLANRIVLSPMTRSRGGAARLANQVIAEYYTQRSSAGLLITEGTTISEEAKLERVAGHLFGRDDRRVEAHHKRRA
jgi:2,4-dienoyl-CoA reductase-like NADH-dependent reductase (Old Yellow Enzyme family)